MCEIYNEGLNNFDIVYYINLKHRTDRLENITEQLNKTNISKDKINRIEGIYYKTFGILGCAKSHVLALEEFIKSGKDTCIIFEDDFFFSKDQDFINNLINTFFNSIDSYDVLMLSSNILNSQKTDYDFLIKILDAQTLSGYSVSKSFAPTLLYNFKESIRFLENYGVKVHQFCFDIYMKKLQPFSNWYCLNPRIGKQCKSYSDIENNIVDYDC
jgi:GR25 family glycosyltransferase involved in LPS biosynthesis